MKIALDDDLVLAPGDKDLIFSLQAADDVADLALGLFDLAQANSTENVDLLSQVPGIGKKMASRLVLELKGKLESIWVGAAVLGEGNAEAIAALVSLGYSPSQAASAIAAIADSPDLAIEDKIKLALQHFAAR